MPLAIPWPEQVKAGREIDDLISSIDFAPTMLEAAGVEPHPDMTGKSFLNVLKSDKEGQVDKYRTYTLSGRERHSHSRYDNWGYPSRSIRTDQYLYIHNFKPNRWPAGTPEWYHDIDNCPTQTFLEENKDDPKIGKYLQLAVGKRPQEELFDIDKDPACLNNLAEKDEFADIKKKLSEQLMADLKAQGDPRVTGNGDIFESYPRFSSMRDYLRGFTKRGEYNPEYQ